MAEIFLARKEGPEGFQRDLVVKRILPHLSADPSFTSMFLDEARIAARLAHPNVVHVYDFGEVDGSYYLAMELVRGVDLHATIRRAADRARQEGRPGTAMPPHHAAKVLSFVCEGLAHAHGVIIDGKPAGLVHRDMSPSNVLISFDGAVKVADFGIAKADRGLRTDVTVHGQVKGKYAYMSPEQARGERLDHRSDLFNVGLMLVEAITGESVFPLHDYRAAKIMSATGTIPNQERIDALPEPIVNIVYKALSFRARDRYDDALALRADLESFLRSWPDHSDGVEIGRYIRHLFPDVLAEDARSPRAAGTVPGTAVAVPTGEVPVKVYDDGPTVVQAHPKAPGAAAIAPPIVGADGPTTPVDPDLGSERKRRSRPPPPPPAPPPGRPALPARTPGTPPVLIDPALASHPTAIGSKAVTTPAALPVRPGPGATPAGAHPILAPIPDGPGTLASREVATDPGEPRSKRGAIAFLIAAALGAALLGFGAWQLFFGGPGETPPVPASAPVLPPRVAPPPASATLRVASEPVGLDLVIDGRPHGTTPAILSLAPEVPHEIAVTRSGTRVAFTTVVLSPGEDRELVLREVRAPEARVRVATTPPGAMVRIDGLEIGPSPIERALSPGEHRLELALAGHAPESTTITLGDGERATHSFSMRPLLAEVAEPPRGGGSGRPRGGHNRGGGGGATEARTGTLTIATTPWSEVFLGSRRLGTTPLANVRLPAGTHTLTLRAPGRNARRHTVTIEADREARVRLAL